MKKRYGISFLVIALVLCVAYYGSYKFSSKRLLDGDPMDIVEKEQPKDEFVAADTINKDKITSQTSYILESYNTKDLTLTEESQTVPVDFVGMTRDDLIDHLKLYESDPALDDIERGFMKFELVSFSKNEIVLRKTFSPPVKGYKYYLVEENGYITVYYMDKKSVYEYTDIQMYSLPEDIQKEVAKGKFISDIHELYDFLENYSS